MSLSVILSLRAHIHSLNASVQSVAAVPAVPLCVFGRRRWGLGWAVDDCRLVESKAAHWLHHLHHNKPKSNLTTAGTHEPRALNNVVYLSPNLAGAPTDALNYCTPSE